MLQQESWSDIPHKDVCDGSASQASCCVVVGLSIVRI